MYVPQLGVMVVLTPDDPQEADVGRWHSHVERLHRDDVGHSPMPLARQSPHRSRSIYYVFFITIMRIPPEKLQRPFIISSVMFGGT